ncbi:MAG: hypothetical protein ACYCZY_00145 [Lacisediminihabitans sp.]
MSETNEPPEYRAYARPRASLLRNGILSFALVSLPLFGALYFLGVPNGSWPIALAFQLVTLVLAGLAYSRYRRTFIGVTRTSIDERGFLTPKTSVPLAAVHNAVLAETYRSSSPETVGQLLLRDAEGKRMLRMRGSFWTESDMRAVAAAIDVPLAIRADAITAKTFFEDYPGSAYWFENRRRFAVLAVAAALVVLLGVVLGLMTLMGIPIDGSR